MGICRNKDVATEKEHFFRQLDQLGRIQALTFFSALFWTITLLFAAFGENGFILFECWKGALEGPNRLVWIIVGLLFGIPMMVSPIIAYFRWMQLDKKFRQAVIKANGI